MTAYLRRRAPGYMLLACCFALWELFTRIGWIDPNLLPPVSDVIESLYELTVNLEIIRHLGVTLRRVLLGYALGGAVGYGLGFACGCWPRLYALLEFTVEYLRPMPSVALIPIALLFLGMGDALNIAIIAWACSWPVFINTMDGVASVDPVLVRTGRTFGLGRAALQRKVLGPASLPAAFTGLRIGLGIAVAVVVITEMSASSDGLGAFILAASLNYHVAQMYAGIVVVGLFGYVLNRCFVWLESRILCWNIGRCRGAS